MEAAFPGHVKVIGLVPTATQLGFAAGLLLLVPLGDRFDRRRLILIQLSALTLSLAAVALAWSLVVASALVGGTSSVAQQVVPFAAELAEPSRRGATIVVAVGLLLATVLPGSQPRTQEGYGALLKSLVILWRKEPQLRRATHHSRLSVRLVQRALDNPRAATRHPIPPQRRNCRLVRHHRCGRRALCANRREGRRPKRSSYRHRTWRRHHAHILGGLCNVGHDRRPDRRCHIAGLRGARCAGLEPTRHLCASPGSA